MASEKIYRIAVHELDRGRDLHLIRGAYPKYTVPKNRRVTAVYIYPATGIVAIHTWNNRKNGRES